MLLKIPSCLKKYVTKLFEFINENNIKPKNIININKKEIMIGCNKIQRNINWAGRKNNELILLNTNELVTVIESIYADSLNYHLFFFRGTHH